MDYRPQIESGDYDVTCNGKPIQIVKWDCKGPCPILCVMQGYDGNDEPKFFTEKGCTIDEKLWLYVEIPNNYNEVELAIESLISKIDGDYAVFMHSYSEYIKEFAPIIIKAVENMSMPKWHKVTGEIYSKEAVLVKRVDDQQVQPPIFEGYTVAADHTLTPNNYKYYIKVSELEKLPIEE
jgi:hypothetical protein